MLLQEGDVSSGLWSNNSSNASLNEYTLPNAASSSSSLQHHQPQQQQQHQEQYQNETSSLSLSDISVCDILEVYKHDSELLKHILLAKTEEDKRRTAEEVRRTEETRLQCKYLEFNWEQRQHFTDPSTFTNEFLSGSLGSLAVSSAEAIPDWLSVDPGNTMATLSPSPIATSLTYFDQTPPSPTTTSPSPFVNTSFDAPFADLSISAASSPESLTSSGKTPTNSNNTATIRITTTNSSSSVSSSATTATTTVYGPVDSQHQDNSYPHHNDMNFSQSSSSLQYETLADHHEATLSPDNNSQSTKSACKRTLSRTRSQRRPVIPPGKKKNRSIPQQQQQQQQPANDEPQLDHVTVMEALRAKLRRSSNSHSTDKNNGTDKNNSKLIWPTSLEKIVDPPQPMSPQGMLLLDLKNPRRIFPNNNNKRTVMNPKVAVLRRPKPFTSAHNHCEKSKDASTTTPVSIK